MSRPVIVWFRQDLRLADNPALHAAAETGRPVLPLFVLDDAAAGAWRLGGATRWWLHHSLAALGEALAGLGTRLVLRRGSAEAVVTELARATGAAAVFWHRRYEPWAIAQGKAIETALRADGFLGQSFNAGLIHEPWEVTQKGGAPYRVFTAFARAWVERGPPAAPLPPPHRLTGNAVEVASDRLESWRLLPNAPDRAASLRQAWEPGEATAVEQAATFLDEAVEVYEEARDYPARAGTSRLSPHLRWGEISPRQIRHAAQTRAQSGQGSWARMLPFVRQLCWRDFAYHTLYHFPSLPDRPLRPELERFPWADDAAALQAWQQGRTGYPIVDAGMRQLRRTGWMPNRVRMIVGSFLTKHLLVDWRQGAAWFWDTLVDADLANNSLNWQWVAGTGIDAAPYFRIFNPTAQAQKVDAAGAYVRRWLPELARLPDAWVHEPWRAPEPVLAAAGVALGRTWPRPIVEHAAARERALLTWRAIRGREADDPPD